MNPSETLSLRKSEADTRHESCIAIKEHPKDDAEES